MKIAVLAANGKVGTLVVKEAIQRNHDVTSFIRNPNSSNNKTIIKNILDLTAEDLNKFDVVISAYGVFDEANLHLYSVVTKHLCDILSNTNTRLLIVGGAGSLYLDTTHTTRLLETKDFPVEYYKLASAAAKSLDEIKTRNNIKWTYISPAAIFDPTGERTGKYRLGGEELMVNKNNVSYISYADYAIAMLDETENTNPHIYQRISVVSNN